jgi:hypothetical protein
MGDPVTTGMMIGAAGGALTSKNPIQGAMMGGALGAAGGSFAGGFSGAAPGTMEAFGAQAYPGVGPSFMDKVGAGFSSVGSDIGGVNRFMNQNPVTSQAGMSLAQNLMGQDQPMQMAPMGQVQRGQPQQMDYMSLLNPQQQSVIRPQPISLL